VTACGVWPGRRGLAAVVVDGAGRARSCSVALTDEARSGFACWLAASGADFVLDEALLPADPIGHLARRAGITVWIAGPPLLPALRLAAGVVRSPPRTSAALLARLPAVPWLRSQLRRLEPRDDPRQIALL
jgi:hypothetical protein